MKFVVDQQLPPALARFIESQGHIANHVGECGLKSSDDASIWDHALSNDLVIVSKDQDFFYFATSRTPAAKLVWIRLGNCRKQLLFSTFQRCLPEICRIRSGFENC